jgi:hypothetical protein
MSSRFFRFFTLFVAFFSLHISYSQDSISFYQKIDTLCSPYFYGRGYEKDGHLKTFEYLQTQFAEADRIDSQEFTFEINRFQGELFLALGKDTLVEGLDFIPMPQSKSGSGKFKMLYLDSIFFTDTASINAFLAKKIDKKVVVFAEKFEPKITSNKTLHDKIYSQSACVLKLITKETLRSFSATAWMPPAFAVKEQYFKNQKKCRFEVAQDVEKITSKNLIVTLKGTDTALSKIILCAHYDHVGGFVNTHIPGANDNASGVAMLLELYDYFQQNPTARTIEFILFAGEEPGLIGSKYYTQNKDLKNIHFLLNLDLIGAGSQGITVVNATLFEKEFNLLQSINDEQKLLSNIKKRGEAANSDHYYFTKKGIRSFFIYTNGNVGGYHNMLDTPDKLERGYFVPLFTLFKDFVLKLDSI